MFARENPISSVPLKTRIGVGAAAILAAGAMIGIGISGASASTTPSPSPSATASPSTGSHAKASKERRLLPAFLNIEDNSPQAAGDRAAKIATTLVNHPQLFTKLPAALQTDLNALKNAASTDRVKDGLRIKTRALSGGYGSGIQKHAQNLEKTGVRKAGFVQELRTVLKSSNPGAGAQTIADQIIAHKNLLAKLPANLQTDLQTLKSVGPSNADAQARQIKTTALNGGYGTRIQKIIRHLEAKHPATPASSTGATS